MKTILKYIAVPLVLALCLVLVSYKACRLYDENSVLKGRDVELTNRFNQDHEALMEFSQHNAELLAQLEQASNDAAVAARKYEDAAHDAMDTFKTVGELKANAENDKALIVELEIEISKRDEALNKLILAYAEKEKQVRAMRSQYTALAVELNKTKVLLSESIELNVLRAERIKALEKSLAGSKLKSHLKTGVVVGLTAVVIYGLVK